MDGAARRRLLAVGVADVSARPEPGTIMDDDQLGYWRARAEEAEAGEVKAIKALLELADAWPVLRGWCWFVLGILAGLVLGAVWPGS
jgi:hypothetical protein